MLVRVKDKKAERKFEGRSSFSKEKEPKRLLVLGVVGTPCR
jgi:hypothetical protein